MRIVKPSVELEWVTPNALQIIERAGRTCYKSEDKITVDSAEKFVRGVIKSGHESVVEHAVASFRIICDRGVANELVRHRVASYCLSGDTTIWFDLPSGQGPLRHRRKYAVPIRQLYRCWEHGACSTINRKRKLAPINMISPEELYSSKDLACLTGRRRETINNLVRLGYLSGHIRHNVETDSPNKRRMMISGADWISYVSKQTTVSVPMQDRLKNMKIRCCDNETGEIVNTNIVNVVYSGVKQVFNVVLDNGYQIKASKDHLFMTNLGWKRLEDAISLKGCGSGAVWDSPPNLLIAVNGYPVGTLLNVAGNRRGMSLTTGGRRNLSTTKHGHLNPRWRGGITPERQKIAKWTSSIAPTIHAKFNYTCQLCGLRGGSLHVHHVDPVYHNVSRAYEKDNLLTVHASCHRQLESRNLELALLSAIADGISPQDFWKNHHFEKQECDDGKKSKRTTRLVRDWARIVKVDFVGDEDTYDIEVASDHHNFVANGFIVHNSQESTRYCGYSKEKFGGHISLIHPLGLTETQIERREKHFQLIQALYDLEIADGLKPQIARGVLPTCLKTELVCTMNFREWRHVFKLRTSPQAHPQIDEVMRMILVWFKKEYPVIVEDIN